MAGDALSSRYVHQRGELPVHQGGNRGCCAPRGGKILDNELAIVIDKEPHLRGANAILALRCCHLNGRFEDYWEARRAA